MLPDSPRQDAVEEISTTMGDAHHLERAYVILKSALADATGV